MKSAAGLINRDLPFVPTVDTIVSGGSLLMCTKRFTRPFR
jgi:hypothetical protein